MFVVISSLSMLWLLPMRGLNNTHFLYGFFFLESLCAIILIDLSKYFQRVTFMFIKFIINKVDEQL